VLIVPSLGTSPIFALAALALLRGRLEGPKHLRPASCIGFIVPSDREASTEFQRLGALRQVVTTEQCVALPPKLSHVKTPFGSEKGG